MSVAEELRILVKAEVDKAKRDMKSMSGTTNTLKKNMKSFASALVGVGSVTAGLLVMKRLVIDNVREGVRFAASMEKQQVAFNTILGSTERATKLFKELKDFSASTPFQLPQLTSATEKLLAFGTAADDIVETMERLGNAALGDSEKLDRLVLAFGKVQAKGRATMEELNMFVEAGVPIMAQLAKQTGSTQAEVFKLVSTGKIGFREVNTALTELTTGQGMMAALVEEQAKTLSGVMSTYEDNLALLRADLVQELIPALKDTFWWMSEVLQKWMEARQVAGIDIGKGEARGIASRILEGDVQGSDASFISTISAQLRSFGDLQKQQQENLASVFGVFDVALFESLADTFADKLSVFLEEAELLKKSEDLPIGKGRTPMEIDSALEQMHEILATGGVLDDMREATLTLRDKFTESRDITPSEISGLSVILARLIDAGYEGRAFGPTTDNMGGMDLISFAKKYDLLFNDRVGQTQTAPFTGSTHDQADIGKALTSLFESIGESGSLGLIGPGGLFEGFSAENIRVAIGRALGPAIEEFPLSRRRTESEGITPAMVAQRGAYGLDEGTADRSFVDQLTGQFSKEELARQKEYWETMQSEAEKTDKILENLGQTMAVAFGGAALAGLKEFGRYIGNGSINAADFADAIEDIGVQLLASLPNMLLSAAVSAAVAQQWGLAGGLLALSGVAALTSGTVSGYVEQERKREDELEQPGNLRGSAKMVNVRINVAGTVTSEDNLRGLIAQTVGLGKSPV